MSNYSFRAHAASDRRKWIIVTIAILFIVAVIVIGCLTDWFTNWNKYCLFGHDYGEDGICTRCGKEKLDEVQKDKETPEDNKEPVEGNTGASVNGGGMATVLPGNGIRLMAAKMIASDGVPLGVSENTWTLTATVNEHADDKYLNWSVEWVNPSSEWATGKIVTDYMTITPTQAGALTATAKVLKAFGEQIKVVCTARDTALGTKKAECLFDYVQKITGITFNMPSISSETTSFSYEFDTTDYTVASEMKLTTSNVCNISASFLAKLKEIKKLSLYDNIIGVYDYCRLSVRDNFLTLEMSLTNDVFFNDGVVGVFVGVDRHDESEYMSSKSIIDSEMNYIFREAIQQTSGAHATFDISFSATYNGKTYSSGTKTIEVRFDGEAIHVPVSDVTLDQDHIYA